MFPTEGYIHLKTNLPILFKLNWVIITTMRLVTLANVILVLNY